MAGGNWVTVGCDVYIIDIHWPPETFIKRKIDCLVANGYRVVVCTVSARRIATPEPGITLIPLYRLVQKNLVLILFQLTAHTLRAPLQTLAFWRHIRTQSPSYGQAIRQFLRTLALISHEPGLIHFEWNSAAVAFLPLFDWFSCPVVLSCRGSQIQVAPHNPRRSNFYSQLAETFLKAAAVHCVSDAIVREAASLGLDSTKATVIRPAVDPDYFYPDAKRSPNSIPVIISVGSLNWVKGYEYALQAIRLFVDQGYDVRFRIIGDGPERQRILYTIFDLDLANQVELLGKLPAIEVKNALRIADIFLLSSLSEGISNAALEAMACGIPVVSTDVGGMSEAISDGIEGYLVPPRDPASMATRLAELIANPLRRELMGQYARQRVLREFTLERQAKQFISLYKAVMQEGYQRSESPTR